MQKSKEGKQYDDPGKSMKLSSFKVKNLWMILPNYPQGKQIHYDRMKVLQYILSLKSNVTYCSTYSHDHMQLRIHGLFYLNLLNINTHVCDSKISLKTLNYQLCMILL